MGNMVFNQRVMDEDTPKKYDFDNYNVNNHSEHNIHMERRIFPQHMYGGPKGLGDPFYRELSKMEEDPMIPQRMRDITRTQTCTSEVENFSKCSKDNGFSMFYYCRDVRDLMMDCQKGWFDRPEFQEAVKEEYLNERSHYRNTGIKTKRYNRGTFIKRDLEKDPPLDKDGNYRPQKPVGWDESYPDGPPSWANFKYT
ncbi:uncharacterized protein LOC111716634 isoform X4 [Eurytemora carolleeae]|uniref:uncharacterized protein LOC111716634 isoform X3 n=1 Tax=Eurytemora carolleeae TaxID=1294199 RepID=UPI000C76E851|nr:uncharacterized protein LOC111716634 isoform X3 [Eurytemora carolleeae]XP_023347878.1 uncharacterized protein LOC111716634 isoform X4 [Eurytemora carolleeae]|eukprot:XP_023347877.1 uncharacterized protein LOC111716634 isoform X3 [Eurytemora affinis]